MTEKIILEQAGGHIETQYSRFQSDKRDAGLPAVSKALKLEQMKNRKLSYNHYVTGNREQRSKVHNTVTSNTDYREFKFTGFLFFFFSRTRSKLGI